MNIKKYILLFLFAFFLTNLYAKELKSGQELLTTYKNEKTGEKYIGHLYPEDNYLRGNFNIKTICSKIAPASDGYVELEILLTDRNIERSRVSLFVKSDDEII